METEGPFVRILNHIRKPEVYDAFTKQVRQSVRSANMSQNTMDSKPNNAKIGVARTEQENRRGTDVYRSKKQRESSDPNKNANRVGESQMREKRGQQTLTFLMFLLTAVMFVVRRQVLYAVGTATRVYHAQCEFGAKHATVAKANYALSCSHRQIESAFLPQ